MGYSPPSYESVMKRRKDAQDFKLWKSDGIPYNKVTRFKSDWRKDENHFQGRIYVSSAITGLIFVVITVLILITSLEIAVPIIVSILSALGLFLGRKSLSSSNSPQSLPNEEIIIIEGLPLDDPFYAYMREQYELIGPDQSTFIVPNLDGTLPKRRSEVAEESKASNSSQVGYISKGPKITELPVVKPKNPPAEGSGVSRVNSSEVDPDRYGKGFNILKLMMLPVSNQLHDKMTNEQFFEFIDNAAKNYEIGGWHSVESLGKMLLLDFPSDDEYDRKEFEIHLKQKPYFIKYQNMGGETTDDFIEEFYHIFLKCSNSWIEFRSIFETQFNLPLKNLYRQFDSKTGEILMSTLLRYNKMGSAERADIDIYQAKLLKRIDDKKNEKYVSEQMKRKETIFGVYSSKSKDFPTAGYLWADLKE